MNITFINILLKNLNIKNAQNFTVRKIIIINLMNARYKMINILLSQTYILVAKISLRS